MDALQITGNILKVLPAQSGTSQRTGNTWMSQEYVLQFHVWDGARNPNFFVFRVFGEDRIKQFNLQPNDEVKVRFHVEAHEYNGRWFNEIRIDAVKFVGNSSYKNPQQAAAQAPSGQQTEDTKPQNEKTNGNDDLPF